MAGIIDGLLGAALGASGAVVNNAQFARQQQSEQDKENRAMNRETFLMELRAKYAKDQAQLDDGLVRGRMDKQAQITKDNAKYSQDLTMGGLSDPRKIDAEKRQRQGAMEDYQTKGDIDSKEWAKRNGVTHAQALELLGKQQAGQRSLLNMRLAAKGKGGADDDDAIGDPDFIGARKDLYGYLGIDAGADEGEMRAAKKRLGLPDKATPKEVQDVLKAATNVYAANPNLSPDEALKFGSEILYGKINLGTAPVGGNGRKLQYFTAGGRRYGYGRPN